MPHELPNANALPYWKTSTSSAGAWLDKAEREVARRGGTVFLRAKGLTDEGGTAFLLEFGFGVDRFRAIWPVLPTKKSSDHAAAERQAATMLYHDIKGRGVRHDVFGPRVAYFDFLLLGDGRTASQLSAPELVERAPLLLPPAAR